MKQKKNSWVYFSSKQLVDHFYMYHLDHKIVYRYHLIPFIPLLFSHLILRLFPCNILSLIKKLINWYILLQHICNLQLNINFILSSHFLLRYSIGLTFTILEKRKGVKITTEPMSQHVLHRTQSKLHLTCKIFKIYSGQVILISW